jgi:hypothetical protein
MPGELEDESPLGFRGERSLLISSIVNFPALNASDFDAQADSGKGDRMQEGSRV